jgi:hypothetical protein
MQIAPTRESCRRLLIQCVVIRRTAAFIRAKCVNTGDNMDFMGAFIRPIIFTLSLDFVFISFILLAFSNHLFPRFLLDLYNSSEVPVASTHAQGPENGPPLSRPRTLKE